MKLSVLFVAVLCLLAIAAGAQQTAESGAAVPAISRTGPSASTPASLSSPSAERPRTTAPGVRLQTATSARKPSGEIRHDYDGVFVRASRTKNPLQLINPGAAPQFGPSEQFLSVNPITKKPEGIRLFSLRFW